MLTPRRGGSRPQSLHKKIANPRPSPYCVTSEIFCQKKSESFFTIQKTQHLSSFGFQCIDLGLWQAAENQTATWEKIRNVVRYSLFGKEKLKNLMKKHQRSRLYLHKRIYDRNKIYKEHKSGAGWLRIACAAGATLLPLVQWCWHQGPKPHLVEQAKYLLMLIVILIHMLYS